MLTRSLAAAFALVVALAPGAPARGPEPSDAHVAMGMPSKAGSKNKNDFLVKKENYVLSYNDKKGTPNWVSWHLTRAFFGDAPRFPFRPDDTLPAGMKQVTTKDYTGSGFDRGHMCPHSDRDRDSTMSRETFFMTNIVPQSAANNQKAWNQLELYCRMLVESKKKECYIVSGPAGVGGTGLKGKMLSIANGKVTVPAVTWKVIMVVKAGVTNPAQVKGSETRLIAVIVPNDMTPGHDWTPFRVTVREVEQLTGLTFFDRVTDPDFLDDKDEVDHIPIGPPLPVSHD